MVSLLGPSSSGSELSIIYLRGACTNSLDPKRHSWDLAWLFRVTELPLPSLQGPHSDEVKVPRSLPFPKATSFPTCFPGWLKQEGDPSRSKLAIPSGGWGLVLTAQHLITKTLTTLRPGFLPDSRTPCYLHITGSALKGPKLCFIPKRQPKLGVVCLTEFCSVGFLLHSTKPSTPGYPTRSAFTWDLPQVRPCGG